MSRLTFLPTGIVTEVPPNGGKVTVEYPEDKQLKYNRHFKKINNESIK